ncbi:uncharacterized protein LOC112843455 [Oreochromis niloticus]|uniref:uncharacterized protein LOC112843455 n=1 Tax=Oreochromis niloticus TaxID=8128 RepID=UPI000DF3D732|nr:zinc finger CCHC domain-containing protein 3 [Oreochromis niloticus]CAI5681862.1 unnamed protein product [Mustela putorius furo]
MPPYAPLSFASNFSNLWVRLKYIGNGDPPTRDYVAEELLLQTSWLNVQDIYSFIALPSKRDFELCFTQEAPLRRFLEISLSNASHPKWKDWQVESSVQVEVVTLVVKFWTGRIPDQDIELYLKRYCEILQPPVKPVDKFGLWYGVRKYKVRMRRDEAGHIISIPNSISLGPYNGRIIYPGQTVRCFICQDPDHQARECSTIKCWKCGELGHKAKICLNESECSLCGAKGHTFFKCPKSFVNILKSSQQPRPSDTMDFPSLEDPSQVMDPPVNNQVREPPLSPPLPSPPLPPPPTAVPLPLPVSFGLDNPQVDDQDNQSSPVQNELPSPLSQSSKKSDESNEELDGNLIIETSDGENKSDSNDEEIDSEQTPEDDGDSEDHGSFPLTEAASLALASLPEETKGKRKTFFSGSHPALDELVNEDTRGGRKRSVSASSCGRDKRKDNRPSPPSAEKTNNGPETWESFPLERIETVSFKSALWTRMLDSPPCFSFFLNEWCVIMVLYMSLYVYVHFICNFVYFK